MLGTHGNSLAVTTCDVGSASLTSGSRAGDGEDPRAASDATLHLRSAPQPDLVSPLHIDRFHFSSVLKKPWIDTSLNKSIS